MVQRTTTSADGRYTVFDDQSFSYESEMSDAARGSQYTYLIDNKTGVKTELYAYSGLGGGTGNELGFSGDSLCVIYPITTGWDFGRYDSIFSYRVYDITTGRTYDFIQETSSQVKVTISEDGSKLSWVIDGGYKVRGTFYFPTVPQFSLPTASGIKVDQYGSGKLNVGDSISIKLGLEGITFASDPQKITLSLSSGGTAVYDAEASKPGQFYVFKYTVNVDDFAKNVQITSVNLNGAVLQGRDGQSALISGDLKNIAGVLDINGYVGTGAGENFAGTTGAETFEGRGGDDIYRVNNPGDKVVEAVGGGNDTVVATIDFKLAARQEIETIRVAKSEGSADIDLTGNEFAQTLEGNSGNNVLDGGGGADSMRGFRGDDTYIVDNARDFVREIEGQGIDTVKTSTSYALALGQEIEVLRAATPTGYAALRLTGNEIANTLIGNAGNNVLDGGRGGDTLIGGAGNDTYLIDNAGDRVVEAVGGGFDTLLTSIGLTLAGGQEVEVMQLLSSTGNANLNLTGNEFAQTLRGNGGANILDGRGGADTMYGGGGNDTYAVNDAGDRVFESKGSGSDTVVSTVTWAIVAGQEIEKLQLAQATGTKALDLTGNEFSQTLRGNAGNNVLDGRGGSDTMVGLGGNDTYRVDDARDAVIEAKGGGFDTVVSVGTYALGDGQEIEALRLADPTSQRNLDLTGNAFGQSLHGNAGSNVLDGRSGADVLTGGAGLDAFLFSTKLGTGNVDRITDFAPVDDTIRLAQDIFATLDAGPLAARAFKNVSAGTVDADDRILYKQATGELFYDADGSGKGAAVKFAVLDNHAKLTHDDFFVV